MSKPIATVGSSHWCPLFDGNKPHLGGQVIEGSTNVFVEQKPICRQGDRVLCNSPSINHAGTGSFSVFANNKPVARLGDSTTHQGKITSGATSVSAG